MTPSLVWRGGFATLVLPNGQYIKNQERPGLAPLLGRRKEVPCWGGLIKEPIEVMNTLCRNTSIHIFTATCNCSKFFNMPRVREASRRNFASTAKEIIHHSLFTINSQQSYTLSVLGNWSLWVYCSSHFSSQGGHAISSIICILHIYKLASLSNSQVVFLVAFLWSLCKSSPNLQQVYVF